MALLTALALHLCYLLPSNWHQQNADHVNFHRLEELAAPYLILTKAGHDVTIASVKGGNIPLDPTSMKPENLEGITKTFVNKREIVSSLQSACLQMFVSMQFSEGTRMATASREIVTIIDRGKITQKHGLHADMDLLKKSVPISGLKADDFDVIYIPGGHGIAVDGPTDLTLRKLISNFAAQGKLVSAVCHGPVAFSGPEVNGKPIVAGKRVSDPPLHASCSSDLSAQPRSWWLFVVTS